MQVFLVKTLVAMLAWVSLPTNHMLGGFLGWLAWVLHTRLRRVTEINLKLCFPDWSSAKRHQIGRASLIETGKALTESAWIWHRPSAQLESLVMGVQGEALLRQAQEQGCGVLAATPHLGSWEFSALPFSRNEVMTYLYRSPRASYLEPLLIKWRANLNTRPARLDRQGLKSVLQELRRGGVVGVLPDQEPDRENGVHVPFFGVPANTMTLLSKLAARSEACVLFSCAERLPRGKGWKIHFIEADSDIAHKDKQVAAAALNRSVERCIQICPTQYLWSYRRFRQLADGGRRSYR
jgi:KDO2-lipid IV(A) lauroyltransferase